MLQTKPDMPAPALRLVLVISTLAETTLILFHALPTTALKCYQQRTRGGRAAAAADGKSATEGPASDSGSLAADSSSHSALVAAVHGAEVAAGTAELLALQQQQQQGAWLPTWQQPAAAAATAAAAAEAHGSPRHTAPLSPPPLAAGVDCVAGAVATVTPVATLARGPESALGSAAEDAAPLSLSSAAAARPPANHTACPAAIHISQKPPSGALSIHGYSSIDTAATAGTLPAQQPPPRSASSRLLSKLKLRRVQTFVRPEVAFPMRRGLSMRFEQLQSERPALTRYLALATLTVSFSATCGLQLCAPGFVDPSLGEHVL